MEHGIWTRAPSTFIFCPLQVDSVELVGLIIRFLSRASFAEIKLAVHTVSGTAVTLNDCMPSLRLSSHNRSGGVMEVFLIPPSIVLKEGEKSEDIANKKPNKMRRPITPSILRTTKMPSIKGRVLPPHSRFSEVTHGARDMDPRPIHFHFLSATG